MCIGDRVRNSQCLWANWPWLAPYRHSSCSITSACQLHLLTWAPFSYIFEQFTCLHLDYMHGVAKGRRNTFTCLHNHCIGMTDRFVSQAIIREWIVTKRMAMEKVAFTFDNDINHMFKQVQRFSYCAVMYMNMNILNLRTVLFRPLNMNICVSLPFTSPLNSILVSFTASWHQSDGRKGLFLLSAARHEVLTSDKTRNTNNNKTCGQYRELSGWKK